MQHLRSERVNKGTRLTDIPNCGRCKLVEIKGVRHAKSKWKSGGGLLASGDDALAVLSVVVRHGPFAG
jgi:hypothetical protein